MAPSPRKNLGTLVQVLGLVAMGFAVMGEVVVRLQQLMLSLPTRGRPMPQVMAEAFAAIHRTFLFHMPVWFVLGAYFALTGGWLRRGQAGADRAVLLGCLLAAGEWGAYLLHGVRDVVPAFARVFASSPLPWIGAGGEGYFAAATVLGGLVLLLPLGALAQAVYRLEPGEPGPTR